MTLKTMKKATYLLILITGVFTLVACGGSEVEKPQEEEQIVKIKGLEMLDLSPYGYNLSIMVPKAEMNGVAEVELTESGALQIIIGLSYGIEIMYGAGDIELLKQDLEEDLIFNSEIVLEEKNALVYTLNIPDVGVKFQNHFMYRAEIGNDIYEVRDIAAQEYGLGMIEKMLESAKTIDASDRSAM